MEHINRIEIQGVVRALRINAFYDRINMLDGKRVANFKVVTKCTTTSPWGKLSTETMWHNVVAWEGQCDISGLEKDCNVRVVGRLRATPYTDANGNEKDYYEVVASEVSVLR